MALDYCYVPDDLDWEESGVLAEQCLGTHRPPPQREIDEWILSKDTEWSSEGARGAARLPMVFGGESQSASKAELDAEIKRAEQMLDYEGADEADVPVLSGAALDRAVSFLRDQWELIHSFRGAPPPVPIIGPGPNKSVDLHWKRESWELLVNIPRDPDEPASFYGDDYGIHKIKGSFDSRTMNGGLLFWLMKI